MVLSVRSDLDRAQRDVRSLSLSSLADSGLRPAVGPALEAIERAERTADNPLLGLIAPIPLLGDQVRGLRDITDRLALVADAGDAALERVEEGLAATDGATDRVTLVSETLGALDDVHARIRTLPPAQDHRLIGPLRSAADRLDEELRDAPDRILEVRTRLEAIHDIVVGPTRVLLLASNNAEMRAGMGMHLSAGVVTVEDGGFESSRFVPTAQLTRRTAQPAEVPDELEELYGDIWDFGHEWRTVSTTPNFPTVGQIFHQLAPQTPAGEVDMVVSMDVPALARLLRVTGPVDVDGTVVTAGNVVDLLLRDNYLALGETSDAVQRRDLQSRIAGVIFEMVTERDVDILTLAAELSDAAEGRHLLGWSPDPREQELWESIGADGALSPTSFLVAAQNASASKRDYYIDPTVVVQEVDEADGPRTDGRRRFRAVLELENPEVFPTAPYVDSLNPLVPVGVHRAYITFYLPTQTEDVEVIRGAASRFGTDGPSKVAAVWLRVPVEERRFAAIEFTLPRSLRFVELVPSGRIRPVIHQFGTNVVPDAVDRRVALPRALSPPEPQIFAALAVVLAYAGLVLVVARSRRLEHAEPDRAAARTDAALAAGMWTGAAVLAVLAAL